MASIKKGSRIPHEREVHMTSDHRIAGSSPAGCKLIKINNLKAIYASEIRAFLAAN